MVIKALEVPPIGTNCYLLEDNDTKQAAVIDPGGAPEAILDRAAGDGVAIKCIFLTHGHYDHTGAVKALREALPGIPVYLHPADAALTGDEIMPSIGETTPYNDGDTVTLGTLEVKVLHTPGHTPGGVCLQVNDTIFSGDTLFQGSMGRTDLPGGNYDQIMFSLKRLNDLPGNYQVLPGHMGPTTLNRERTDNYYMREASGG